MEIEIYTQPWCPYCARAVSILNGKGVVFREIDAPHGSAEREASIRRSGGQTTVPQIFIDGRPIGATTWWRWTGLVVSTGCCTPFSGHTATLLPSGRGTLLP